MVLALLFLDLHVEISKVTDLANSRFEFRHFFNFLMSTLS